MRDSVGSILDDSIQPARYVINCLDLTIKRLLFALKAFPIFSIISLEGAILLRLYIDAYAYASLNHNIKN